MPPRRLAMVAIVKDEAPGIFEWLAHHAALGFDHFYLYDNGSTDRTRDEIAALPGPARTTVIDWKIPFGQIPAYQDALTRFGPTCRWMAFFDADEFLNPLKDERIKDILRDFEAFAGLAIPWACFGSSGHDRRPPGGVLENYLQRAAEDFDPNRHVKCIIDPSRVVAPITPHLFALRGSAPIVLDDGTPVDPKTAGLLPAAHTPTRLRLNHYLVKSREDFALKSKRGLAVRTDERNEGFFHAMNRNDVADDTALRFLPAIASLHARRRSGGAGLLRRLWPFS